MTRPPMQPSERLALVDADGYVRTVRLCQKTCKEDQFGFGPCAEALWERFAASGWTIRRVRVTEVEEVSDGTD